MSGRPTPDGAISALSTGRVRGGPSAPLRQRARSARRGPRAASPGRRRRRTPASWAGPASCGTHGAAPPGAHTPARALALLAEVVDRRADREVGRERAVLERQPRLGARVLGAQPRRDRAALAVWPSAHMTESAISSRVIGQRNASGTGRRRRRRTRRCRRSTRFTSAAPSSAARASAAAAAARAARGAAQGCTLVVVVVAVVLRGPATAVVVRRRSA